MGRPILPLPLVTSFLNPASGIWILEQKSTTRIICCLLPTVPRAGAFGVRRSGLPSAQPDNCIRRWPPEEPDLRPQPCCCSWSARRRSRRPLPPPGRAGAGSDRAARGRRRARIWRRGTTARRELGAGGAAARRSTTCASGLPRRGASHGRSSPAIHPPTRRTPASTSDARSRARLVPGLLRLTFTFARHQLLLLSSLLDLRFIY
jgi:hypothetical protein